MVFTNTHVLTWVVLSTSLSYNDVPGVPLINGFLDLLEGHIVSGWAKMSMGFIMVFMIAVGFYVSLFVFGYGNTI